MQGSRPGQCDQASAEALLDRFVEVGGNFIDTADIYQYGDSETIIGQCGVQWLASSCFTDLVMAAGKWLAKKDAGFRRKLVIATKVWGHMDPSDVNARGLSRHHIMSAVEASLRRLQTNYIDLYQVM